MLCCLSDFFACLSGVQRLLPIQDGLSAFELEVKEARQCLLDILANDEDLRGLLLSACVRKQLELSEDAVELLLESYTARLSHMLHRISLLQQRMESRASMAKMSMIIQRNRIMRMNLYTSIGAIPLAAGSMVAGLFGMNLASGLEDTPGLFLQVCVGVGVFGAVLHMAMLHTIFGGDVRNRHVREAGHLEVMKHMLMDMKDLDHAVKVAFRHIDGGVYPGLGKEKPGRLSKDTFRKMLQEARSGSSDATVVGKARDGGILVEDVDVFFDLIDANGDGYIDSKEVKHV
jgi:hypothetical protein